MSLPEFPSPDPCLTREQAINMILVSIAMEEVALSHIIEAESEKITYAIDCLKHCCGCCGIDMVLEVNASAHKILETVKDTQMILKSKMEHALNALPPPCSPPCSPQCRPLCPPCGSRKRTADFTPKPW